MDNFAMERFLKKIGVNDRNIVWGEYPFDLQNQTDTIDDII